MQTKKWVETSFHKKVHRAQMKNHILIVSNAQRVSLWHGATMSLFWSVARETLTDSTTVSFYTVQFIYHYTICICNLVEATKCIIHMSGLCFFEMQIHLRLFEEIQFLLHIHRLHSFFQLINKHCLKSEEINHVWKQVPWSCMISTWCEHKVFEY